MTSKKPQKKHDKTVPAPSIPAISLLAKFSNFLFLVVGNIVMMAIGTLAIYNYDNPPPITDVLPTLPLPGQPVLTNHLASAPIPFLHRTTNVRQTDVLPPDRGRSALSERVVIVPYASE